VSRESGQQPIAGAAMGSESPCQLDGTTSPRFTPRTIGIYGVRAAGKTCYLSAALLGMSSSPTCTVSLADEPSRELLERYWRALSNGELPPATELVLQPLAGSVVISVPLSQEMPTQDNLSPVPADARVDSPADTELPAVQKRRLPFRTLDFGGKLAERGDSGVPYLTAEFRDWLDNADCLLFFLAVDQLRDPIEAGNRLLEVDALLSRLVEKGRNGHAISQPIAVLITKWDLESDLSGDLEEEYQKVKEFLARRGEELGTNICDKIEGMGEQVRVFPVSTFGGHVDGKPIHPLKPFNLHEPLVWALSQTDEYLFKKARARATEALAKPRFWIWRDYKGAIGAYEALINDHGINHGPVYEKIKKELARLRANRRRRSVAISVAAALLIVATAAYWSYYADRSQYIDLVNRLDVPRDRYGELERQVNEYLQNHNPWSAMLGRKGEVEKKWNQYKDTARQEFERLEQIRKTPEPPNLRERHTYWQGFLGALKDFVNCYPGSPYQSQVEEWRNEALSRLEQTKKPIQWLTSADVAIASAERALAPETKETAEMEQAAKSLESAIAEAQKLESFVEFAELGEKRKKLDELRSRLNAEIDHYRKFDQDYEDLLAGLNGQSPEDRRKALDRFLASYPSHEYPRRGEKLDDIQARFMDAGKDIDERQWNAVRQKFEDLRSLAQNLIDSNDVDIEKIREAFDEFQESAQQYKGQTDPAALHLEDLAKLEDKALNLLDNAEWAAVKGFSKKNSKNYQAIAERAKKYWDGDQRLPKERRKHAEDAEKMIRQALADRQNELYTAIYERATNLKSLDDLDKVENSAEEFLSWLTKQTDGPLKDFMPEDTQDRTEQVEKWLRWKRDTLRVRWGRTVEVTIDPTQVSTERKTWAKVTVDQQAARIWLGEKAYDNGITDWFSGKQTLKVEIPSKDFTKELCHLEVAVTIDNWFTYGDTTKKVDFYLPTALFTVDSAVQELEFPGWKGKKATVRIACHELTPPELKRPETR